MRLFTVLLCCRGSKRFKFDHNSNGFCMIKIVSNIDPEWTTYMSCGLFDDMQVCTFYVYLLRSEVYAVCFYTVIRPVVVAIR